MACTVAVRSSSLLSSNAQPQPQHTKSFITKTPSFPISLQHLIYTGSNKLVPTHACTQSYRHSLCWPLSTSPPALAPSAVQTVWRTSQWGQRWSSRRQRWMDCPSMSAGHIWTEGCTECSSGKQAQVTRLCGHVKSSAAIPYYQSHKTTHQALPLLLRHHASSLYTLGSTAPCVLDSECERTSTTEALSPNPQPQPMHNSLEWGPFLFCGCSARVTDGPEELSSESYGFLTGTLIPEHSVSLALHSVCADHKTVTC